MKNINLCLLMLAVLALTVSAQTTEFSYQGNLINSGSPANGNYDFEFKLFDSMSAGAQQGSTLQRLNVAVTNGVFAVSLDFGAPTLPGADRFRDIAVRTTGGGAFTALTPRQKVNSVPYSVRSLNAETAGSVAVAGVPSGSGNYIQNGTSPQASSNFSISGDGTAGGTLSGNVVNSASQYNIGGGRLIHTTGSSNTFVGGGSGANIVVPTGFANSFFGTLSGNQATTGTHNSFFGAQTGQNNTSGIRNSFFGYTAGFQNTTGNFNAFFGEGAGFSNTSGNNNAFFGAEAGAGNTADNNSFFGMFAGRSNTTGTDNAFFGRSAGFANTTGSSNSFFGRGAGLSNTIGVSNAFFGMSAGDANTSGGANAFFGSSAGLDSTTGSFNAFFGSGAGARNTTGGANSYLGYGAGDNSVAGSFNTFIGYLSGLGNSTGTANTTIGPFTRLGDPNLINASALGFRASVTASDSLVLGAISGVNGCFDGCGSVNVGIGVTAPLARLHVVTNSTNTDDNTARFEATAIGPNPSHIHWGVNGDWFIRSAASGGRVILQDTGGNVGIGLTQPNDKLDVNGTIGIATLGITGITQLCRNVSNQISTCSSSLRYKTNIGQFSEGLLFVNKLQPITFDWKDGGMKDVGFGAEDVADIDTRFVTYDDKGEVEGVKYDRLSVAFVNAFKEQQLQIEAQQRQIEELKVIVCSLRADAEICKKKEK